MLLCGKKLKKLALFTRGKKNNGLSIFYWSRVGSVVYYSCTGFRVMSTALGHLGFMGIVMFSGDNESCNFADLLEEQFGPPNAVPDYIDEILSEVEKWLEADSDEPNELDYSK